MKRILLAFMALTTSIAFCQTPCDNGMAGSFPCNGFDLQSTISLGQLGGSTGNDSWGWTDPVSGIEYAITGVDNGTVFIDISDPVNPLILGKLPGHNGSSSLWRDVKVYNNHAYMVSEANGHGMQIFDLTRLRSVTNPPETFTPDGHYSGFGNAHNIVINEETGFAYAVGTNTFGGGPHFINLQDPVNPVAAGGYSLDGYTHDAQVVVYNGPDTDYIGQEIYVGCNTDEIAIVDVTDKMNPVPIATVGYTNIGYTHQGWFTEDQRYFIAGDEFDESNVGFNTRSIIFDFTDLDNPQADFEYFGPEGSIDHNGYVLGDKFYLANYTAGLRVIDISDIANGNMTEIAYFDSHPSNNSVGYSGAWNVYPYFASGNIIISNLNGGFFIVRDPSLSIDETSTSDFAIYPNPASEKIRLQSKLTPISSVDIYSVIGQKVISLNFSDSTSEVINIETLPSGVYILKINSNTTKRLIVK